MGRTIRHKLTGAKAIAHSCGNHGDCPYCKRNRLYRTLREIERLKDEEKSVQSE